MAAVGHRGEGRGEEQEKMGVGEEGKGNTTCIAKWGKLASACCVPSDIYI